MPLVEADLLGVPDRAAQMRWTVKSRKKFKARVKQVTKRTRGHSPKSVIAELQTYVCGAFNYYGLGVAFG